MEHYLVVNSEDRVVGICPTALAAHEEAMPGDTVVFVAEEELADESVELFFLPELSDDIQGLRDVLKRHTRELEALFLRVGSIEEDIYGAPNGIVELGVISDNS